jgi:hypothetical protein
MYSSLVRVTRLVWEKEKEPSSSGQHGKEKQSNPKQSEHHINSVIVYRSDVSSSKLVVSQFVKSSLVIVRIFVNLYIAC